MKQITRILLLAAGLMAGSMASADPSIGVLCPGGIIILHGVCPEPDPPGGQDAQDPPPVQVPEPGTLALLALGIGGLVLTRRRKH